MEENKDLQNEELKEDFSLEEQTQEENTEVNEEDEEKVCLTVKYDYKTMKYFNVYNMKYKKHFLIVYLIMGLVAIAFAGWNTYTTFRNYNNNTKDVYTALTETVEFKEDSYYSKTLGDIEKYQLLTAQPSDLSTNYASYYKKTEVSYTLLSEAKTFEAGKYYKKVEEGGTVKYEVLATEPEDWATNYGTYYSKNEAEYVALDHDVDFAQNTYYEAVRKDPVYTVLASEPADFAANYNSYYSKSVEKVGQLSLISFLFPIIFLVFGLYFMYQGIMFEKTLDKNIEMHFYRSPKVVRLSVTVTNKYISIKTQNQVEPIKYDWAFVSNIAEIPQYIYLYVRKQPIIIDKDPNCYTEGTLEQLLEIVHEQAKTKPYRKLDKDIVKKPITYVHEEDIAKMEEA